MTPTTIELVNGNLLDFSNMEEFTPEISTIAIGLSNTCRFSGQINKFYSVAQHSILVYSIVTEQGGSLDERLQALLHDAPEAFIGDVSTPLKGMLSNYQNIEQELAVRIGDHFGVSLASLPDIVKEADKTALHLEANKLGLKGDWIDTSLDYDRSIVGVTDPDGSIVSIPPYMAREHFQSVYWNLKLKKDKENDNV